MGFAAEAKMDAMDDLQSLHYEAILDYGCAALAAKLLAK